MQTWLGGTYRSLVLVIELENPPSHSTAPKIHGTLRGCSLAADAPDPRQGFSGKGMSTLDKVLDKVLSDTTSHRGLPSLSRATQGPIVTNSHDIIIKELRPGPQPVIAPLDHNSPRLTSPSRIALSFALRSCQPFVILYTYPDRSQCLSPPS